MFVDHTYHHPVAALGYGSVKINAVPMWLQLYMPFAIERARCDRRLPCLAADAVLVYIRILWRSGQADRRQSILDEKVTRTSVWVRGPPRRIRP
jgi:hypothetical protein